VQEIDVDVIGFLFFLGLTTLLGMFLLAIAYACPRFRGYFLLSFVALPSAFFLWVFIRTTLLNHACGPMFAYGPGGEQSLQYCAATWPKLALLPLWIFSTAIVWGITYLVQRWINRRCPFFSGKNCAVKRTRTAKLKA
jgi:hypothetical protein